MDVRGSVTDRAWGLTLGAIALRRHTGQLTIESGGRRYCVVFSDGAIVAASSPMAADAVARVALTSHLITKTLVPEITRRLARSPDRDEVLVLAEATQLSPDQVAMLRHRLVTQRAARTFSVEHGSFVLADQVQIPVVPGVEVDARQVIYLGVRTHVSEQRLMDELRQLGSQFALRPEASGDLARFGFEASAQPVLEALKAGTSLPELEARYRDLDPRSAQAIIYALVSCGACSVSQRTGVPLARVGRAASPTGAPRPPAAPGERTSPGAPPPHAATPVPAVRPTPAQVGLRLGATRYAGITAEDTGTNTPAAMRQRTRSEPGARTPVPSSLAAPAPIEPPPAPRVSTARAWPPAGTRGPAEPPALPAPPGEAAPSEPADRATAATPPPQPGLARPARAGSSTAPPLAVPRTPTPSDPGAIGFGDQRTPGVAGFGEQRTPGVAGFGEQRTPGVAGFGEQRAVGFGEQRTPSGLALGRSPTGSPATARVPTENAVLAEAACKRGELAMKRDQPGEAILEFKAACDLNPQDFDHAGMLAWAKFCAAGDKPAIAAETRKALERAVLRSSRPERARFYLGRVERMLGRDREALRHFQEVLDLKPNHADAAGEIRAIEARLAATGKAGGGLFSRKR